MSRMELATLSARRMIEGYAKGLFTPVEIARAVLEAIGDDAFNAFVFLGRDDFLRDAQASAERWSRHSPIGALDGVPVSIKDLVTVKDWPIRRGSLLSAGEPSPGDAPCVSHLRASGALLLGKTATTEMGCAIHGDSPVHGRSLNPLDASLSIGGSSCGAAAQLAAGWGPLALGSDAGGSVRIPASYAGLVAFKPSFGQIPMGPASAFAEFAHLGPMGRSVGDLALAMQVLGQPDVRDPSSLFWRAWLQASAVRGVPLRIGYCLQIGADLGAGLDEAVAPAMQALVTRLQGRSWRGQPLELVPVDLGGLDVGDALWQTWCSRVLESCLHLDEAQIECLGPDLRRQRLQGLEQTGLQLAAARRVLREGAQQLHQLFCGLDLLLTPSTPGVAPPAGDFVHDSHPRAGELRTSGNWLTATPFSHPFNLTQQPALGLPWGLNRQGLPFGLQLVGRRHADAQVLSFGMALEGWLKESDS